MRRTAALLFLTLALTSCGKQGRAVRLGNVAYYFPEKHIGAIVDPEDSGSHDYYIRLSPPGGYYLLVYAPWKESRPNKQGRGAPTIAHINDFPREITVTQTEFGPLLCAKNPVNDKSAYMREIFTCGFRIHDAGVPWSVIIPGDLAASAPALKRRAQLALANYRTDRRAREATR